MSNRVLKCYGDCNSKYDRSMLKIFKGKRYCPDCYEKKKKKEEEKDLAKCSGTCEQSYLKVNMNIFSSKRYCNECFSIKKREEEDRLRLWLYVGSIFDLPHLDSGLKNQIKKFVEQDRYKYEGIAYTLKYITEVKKIKLTRAYGIGLVPNYYEEARKYFAELARKRNETQVIKIEKVVVKTKPPIFENTYREKKLINMEEFLK